MHVPDGFLDAPTSVATGVVAAAGVAVSIRGARRELDDRTAPVAGPVAAFVFAGQMVNFPVGAGTSGHLLGGALAAVLAGPWTAVLRLSVVLLVQALFMADGGITALGTNVTLMGLVTVAVGWLAFRGLRAVLPRRTSSVAPAAAVAAFGLPVEKRHLQGIRRGVGIVFQDPDDQLFLGTVRQDVAFGRPTSASRGRRSTGASWTPWTGSAWPTSPTARRTTSPAASVAGSRSRPCSRWSRRSWCSTSRRPGSTRPRAGSSPTSCAPSR